MTDRRRSRRPSLTDVFLVALGLLSLRWPWQVSVGTFLGQGHLDRTIVAFVASFVMVATGLPGYFAVLAGFEGTTRGARIVLVGSLLFVLVGCLTSLVWIGTSISAIGGTLTPIQIAGAVFSPMVTALSAGWLRFRFWSEDDDADV